MEVHNAAKIPTEDGLGILGQGNALIEVQKGARTWSRGAPGSAGVGDRCCRGSQEGGLQLVLPPQGPVPAPSAQHQAVKERRCRQRGNAAAVRLPVVGRRLLCLVAAFSGLRGSGHILGRSGVRFPPHRDCQSDGGKTHASYATRAKGIMLIDFGLLPFMAEPRLTSHVSPQYNCWTMTDNQL